MAATKTKTKTTTTTATGLVLALLPAVLGGCPLDEDPGFDEWCGDRLCRWELRQGEIRKAPTWHERDHGVELVGPSVVLAQVTDIDSQACLAFELIADIEPAASVYLEMDFLSDGTTEYRERIPSAEWRPLSFLVAAPTWYEGVTLLIRKQSEGRAVLARLELSSSNGCTGEPIPLVNRPAGATCVTAADCASGVCELPRICSVGGSLCATDQDCGPGAGSCIDWYARACR